MPKLIEMQENESMWEANTAEEKANQLRAQFFSEKTETDLSNIEDFQYSQSVEQLPQIISEMISDVMSKQLSYSASEADEISNVFLKAMSESFVKTAAALTQICWRTAYFLIRFHRTRTVAMRKSEKSNYSASEI